MRNLREDEDSGDFESGSPPPGPPRELEELLRTPTADMRWIMAGLLQKNGEEAAMMIRGKKPEIDVVIVSPGNKVSGFDAKRIVVHVDKSGNVCRIPKVG